MASKPTVYAQPEDLTRLSISAKALSTVPVEEQQAIILAVSRLADGYIASQYSTPLLKWGEDLTQAVCDISVYRLLKKRGFNSALSEGDVLLQAHDTAIGWLKSIANGVVHPPQFVDGTIEVQEFGIVADTNSSSMWD